MTEATHVVVGFGNLVAELDRHLTGARLLVLEEPEIIEARGVAERVAALPSAVGLVPAPTQSEEDEDLTALVKGVPRPDGVRAVIPVNEYAVVAAAALAEAWGLPGADVTAARAFRDKARLRAAVADTGIGQPDWRLVTGPAEVEEFRARHGGACVIKPANRQASLGVSLLSPGDPVEAAWRSAVDVDETLTRTGRVPTGRYLAEQRLYGPEVSVEALVHDGRIVFENITAKTVQSGANPVELGQGVPAALPGPVTEALAAGVRGLVRGTGFRSGVLHAEWILVDGRDPHLVECAARLPGDNIPHLIGLAYGASLFSAYAAVLEGHIPDLPGRPVRGAAIRFLTAPPGIVREVAGRDETMRLPGAHEVEIDVAPGDRIDAVTSSWQRSGQVTATAGDGPAAVARAEELAARIRITTERSPS
ncbi:ATP-grasp domain-containing protein [Streptomyces rhizosphaerihabitans]|uniref:ATP-grasp domain-containing protein n=1 Tax=Streptomyces rhizosphaerihabitans TaxID=1266770 RepID=UPI0021C1BDE1|nr:ATP-grasp domain-containing protein [Streptomyces rhizosphaerihabitans]MCT9008507.1 ATP-grasp domain-containing protein [Streptomyces rhizosphaerihabitans]